MPTDPVAVKIDVKVAKALQELAYATYAHNIMYTAALDAMFASMPGYLKRAHG